MLAFIGVAFLAFCSTDIDDLFVLIALFADKSVRRRDIVAGQFSGIAVLYGASVLCAMTALVIPKAWLGLLGFAPIGIGLWKLRLWKRDDGSDRPQAPPAGLGVLPVAAITVSNGGDNMGAWIPLFATHTSLEVGMAGLLFAALTALWCLKARWLVGHPALRTPIRRYGSRIVPFVLIGLGLLILGEAGSLGLVWG